MLSRKVRKIPILIIYIMTKLNQWIEKFTFLRKEDWDPIFVTFCDQEFMLGSEKDRKEKQIHIREMHTFECNVCKIKHKNKEELDIHLLTCEIYVCSLCSYTHNRLSEM